MYKFYHNGVLIFKSDNIQEIEKEATEFKKENNLKILEIIQGRGKFYKWI